MIPNLEVGDAWNRLLLPEEVWIRLPLSLNILELLEKVLFLCSAPTSTAQFSIVATLGSWEVEILVFEAL